MYIQFFISIVLCVYKILGMFSHIQIHTYYTASVPWTEKHVWQKTMSACCLNKKTIKHFYVHWQQYWNRNFSSFRIFILLGFSNGRRFFFTLSVLLLMLFLLWLLSFLTTLMFLIFCLRFLFCLFFNRIKSTKTWKWQIIRTVKNTSIDLVSIVDKI